MTQKNLNLTKQNIGLASKLLRLQEEKAASAKKSKLEEGTPTQALPPESNATRQMNADVAAASNKSGVPTPVGIEPKPDHGETAMGTQDPMGADAPAQTPCYAQDGEQDGMVKPKDQRGSGGQGPASDTTSSGLKSNAKMEDILKLDGAALVEAFVQYCGGIDEAVFKLLAEGISLVECEAVLVDKKVEEGFFDKAKAGIHAALGGGEKKPSSGYIQHLQKRREQSGRPSFLKKTTPAAAPGFSATRNAGHDARRNR